MARILQIAQLGYPVLRSETGSIANIRDIGIQNIIEDLCATLEDSGGVGIAAPQVYLSLRLLIIAARPNPFYRDTPVMPPLVIAEHVNRQRSVWSGNKNIF